MGKGFDSGLDGVGQDHWKVVAAEYEASSVGGISKQLLLLPRKGAGND
jgi:hypothetical protein